MPGKMLQLVDGQGKPLMSNSYHYGADSTVKEFDSWDTTITAPDQELVHERDALVSRSRDLERNSGLISGLYQTYEDNIIGEQYRLSSRPDYVALGRDKTWADEWSRHVEALWRGYAESTECDAARIQTFHGLTKQILGSFMSTGKALDIALWMPSRVTRTVHQLIDSDRLSNPYNTLFGQAQVDGKTMRGGVEINKYNEEVAYHFRDSHPGESIMDPSMSMLWTRVPARTRSGRRKVLHVFDPKRIGQHMSKPIVTSVMGDIKQTDSYKRFELKNKITQSLVAAFIKTNMDAQQLGDMFGADYESYKGDREKWTGRLNGGAIIPLFPGDELDQFNPNGPSANYAEYIHAQMTEIAVGANISVTTLLKDYSKTNYSSAKAAMRDSLQHFLGRKKLMADMWGTPAFNLWLEEKVSKGEVEAPGYYENVAAYTRCKWIGGARGYVDEAKEADSAVKRMKAKTSTLEQENAVQGNDWEETIQQQLVEDKRVMEAQAELRAYKKELEEEFDVVLDMPSYDGMPEPANLTVAEGGDPEDEEEIPGIDMSDPVDAPSNA